MPAVSETERQVVRPSARFRPMGMGNPRASRLPMREGCRHEGRPGLNPAELLEQLYGSGAGVAVAVLLALLLALELLGKNLIGHFLAEHPDGRTLREGDDALDGVRTAFEEVD